MICIYFLFSSLRPALISAFFFIYIGEKGPGWGWFGVEFFPKHLILLATFTKPEIVKACILE